MNSTYRPPKTTENQKVEYLKSHLPNLHQLNPYDPDTIEETKKVLIQGKLYADDALYKIEDSRIIKLITKAQGKRLGQLNRISR